MDEDQSDWRTESSEGSESTRVEGDHVRLHEIYEGRRAESS